MHYHVHWQLQMDTNKSTLARELEKNVFHAYVIPTPSSCIIERMNLGQKINENNKTLA